MTTAHIRSILTNIVGRHSYYEIMILHNTNVQSDDHLQEHNEIKYYNTNLPANTFHELLNKLGKKGCVKQYKESVIGDIHYCNFDNKEVNVVQRTFDECQDFLGKFVCLSGNKKKLNILSYPSAFECDNEAFHKVYQVKISNRIHIKFVQGKNVDDTEKYYNIIVSCTHEDNVEKKHTIDELTRIISLLIQ
jgi:hypothetical protein